MKETRKRNKLALLFLVVVMAVSLGFLVACAGDPETGAGEIPAASDCADTPADTPAGASGEVVRIEYWHVNADAMGGETIERMIADFNAAHPYIEVVGRFNPDMYMGLMRNLQAEVAAGMHPAIVQVGWVLLDYYAENFAFTDMHTLIQTYGTPEDQTFIEYNFFENQLEMAATRDGVQVGLPYAVSSPVMFLNVDLLREAGLPEEGPTTWAEVREWSRQILDETGRFGVYIAQSSDSWAERALMASHGAQIISEVDGRLQATFACENGIAAYEFYAALILEDATSFMMDWIDGINAFMAGEVAMLVTTIGRRTSIEEGANFEVAAVPFPIFEGHRRQVTVGGCLLGVLAQTPEERYAAWQFLRFLYSHQSVTDWVIGTGFTPMTTRVVEEYAPLREFLDANPMMMSAIYQSPDIMAFTPYPGEDGLRAEQMMIDMRDRILSGQVPAREAMLATQDEINAILP